MADEVKKPSDREIINLVLEKWQKGFTKEAWAEMANFRTAFQDLLRYTVRSLDEDLSVYETIAELNKRRDEFLAKIQAAVEILGVPMTSTVEDTESASASLPAEGPQNFEEMKTLYETNRETFAAWLKQTLKQKKTTQKNLCEMLGETESDFTKKYKSGGRRASDQDLQKLWEALIRA